MNEEAKKFWRKIVYKKGKLDEEQVLKELADYYYVMKQVPRVYCHITGGLLSKIMYPAETVIAKADDIINRDFVHKKDLWELLKRDLLD